MSNRGALRKLAVAASGLVAGVFFLGQCLDSWQNAKAVVSPAATYLGTALLLGGGLLIEALLRTHPQSWKSGATSARITGIGPWSWTFILGAAILLWVPRLLPSEVPGPAHTAAMSRPDAPFFPHFVGTKWTYSLGKIRQEGGGADSRIEDEQGQYSETVVMVRAGVTPGVSTIAIKREGVIPRTLVCDDFDPLDFQIRHDAAYWLVTDQRRMFQACSRHRADKLALELATPTKLTKLPPPEYVLPLTVGALWGADPDFPPRTDTAYQWFVDSSEAVETPAGKFADCYRIAYYTLPDHLLRWVCRGVGLVAWEYHHHGTVEEYRAELIDFSAGALRSGLTTQ